MRGVGYGCIVQMVSRCEDKLNSRDFKVDVKKLAKQLEAPLDFKVNGEQAGTVFLEALINKLPKERVISFEVLKQAWKQAITSIQTETFVQTIWRTTILHPQAKSGVEQAIVDFFTNAPNLDEFVSALLDARYHSSSYFDRRVGLSSGRRRGGHYQKSSKIIY